MTQTSNKCVIYARYSPGGNQTVQSIEGQVTVCKKYAKDNGLIISEIYSDEHLTGRNDRRPDFQRMLKDSAKHKWDFVLVYAIDRFGRDKMEISINKYTLKKNGVKLLSATQRTSENIDGSKNLDGILLESFYEGYAEYYSAELAQKVTRGQKESLAKGQCVGVFCYGYDIVEKKYQINIQEAFIIRRVFDEYAAGATIESIILGLKNDGLNNSKGKTWAKNSLLNMLKNKKYIGIFKYGDTIYPNIVPRIIDDQIFEQVESRLNNNKKAPGKARAKENYILSGKLFCGKCESLMLGESGTSHTGTVYNYYKCNNHKNHKGCNKKAWLKDKLEDKVIAAVTEFLADDKTIHDMAKVIVNFSQEEQNDNTQVDYYIKEIKNNKKAIENLLKAIEMGIINSSTKKRMDELEALQYEMEQSLERELANRELVLTEEEIEFWLLNFKKGKTNDISFKERLIDMFVNKVIVYDDRIVVVMNYSGNGGKRVVPIKEITDMVFNGEGQRFVCRTNLSANRDLHELFITKDYFAIVINV